MGKGVDLAAGAGVVVLTVVAVVGGINFLGADYVLPGPGIKQVTSMGEKFETWAIQNPEKAAETLDGEPYADIVKDILNEEPVSVLEGTSLFYIKQDNEQYGLCVSFNWEDNEFAGEGTKDEKNAFIYSTVIDRTVLAEDCAIDSDETK